MKMKAHIHVSPLRTCAAAALALFLMIRTAPPFARFWAQNVSIPVLQTISGFGATLPFSMLEWGAAIMGIPLLCGMMRRQLRRTAAWMLTALILIFLAIWQPLYSLPSPAYAADTHQMAAAAGLLIERTNLEAPVIPRLDDLPAKPVRFPSWMRIAGISGFASFLTGEGFYDPNLPHCALPFVAVHESMHLQGIADEGAANIAAWQDCMDRGGAYAWSARIWGLRYIMGTLLHRNPGQYAHCINRMNPQTFQLYQECGGAYVPLQRSQFWQAACNFLGIADGLQNYEILAAYLAASIPQ